VNTGTTGVSPNESLCAQEPIHIPGSIQPHGVLFVLAEPDLTITHVSANIEAVLGVSVPAALDVSLSAVFGAAQGARFAHAVRADNAGGTSPMRLTFEAAGISHNFECVAHRSGDGFILEVEPDTGPADGGRLDLFAHVRAPIARMERSLDVVTLLAGFAADVRQLSGFDRAMIYRFDDDWHGEVIAESAADDVEDRYFGLHFPATDIPEQARRLYLKNALRLVPDVSYVAAPLVSRSGDAAENPVDLSRAALRSVSPVHLEYLTNMGVRATLTISIVIGGSLWGLIACHHRAPRRIDYGARAVCELLGNMLAWQIASRMQAEVLENRLQSNANIASLATLLGTQTDVSSGIIAGAQEVLDLIGAQSLVLRANGAFVRYGRAPAADADISQIAAALGQTADAGVATTHCIADILPQREGDGTQGGALLITLSDADDYVLCLRDEVIRTVNWGGDIRNTVTASDGTLHPRSSFDLWRETLRGQSLRWSSHDVAVARDLRSRIVERSQGIERQQAEERIRYLAHHDALTQLPNRAAFYEMLKRTIDEAGRAGAAAALLFVDLDHFKLFNDAFGHDVGDRILQAAATRMRACVRHDDFVARLGGDEFVIILPRVAHIDDADRVASKVIAAISAPFHVPGKSELRFTASVGVAVYPKDADDADTLLQHADVAMYRAKEQGRNAFQHFGLGGSGKTYERLSFERRIQEGLTRGEFVPFYQPISNMLTARIVGMEALARWLHPDLGLLAPAKFIAVAEESRAIVTLGEVMLRAACEQTARWCRDVGALRVSVNVSARQFREPEFLHDVLAIVAETGIAPEALQLEVTESLLIGDEAYAIRTLRALADAGISIAIDDFGTGYSSLSYLKRLPVNVLKIDQSFIRDLTVLADDGAIVRAIIAMAHSLKLKVVAEGVERYDQLAFLQAEDCDEIQGYLIGRPLPAADTTALLARLAAERTA
jgi:diguanylate cyclase (GGDEF)-like protein